jgi:hypothetical protein
MSTDIADAEQDTAEAAAAVNRAEADLAAGKGGVSANVLHKLRDNYRHAALAAQGARAKAERDREAARLSALEELGRQVDELASSALASEMGEALQAVTDGCERARRIAQSWDKSVAELFEAARDLGVGEAAPGGPRKKSGHLAVCIRAGDQSITHDRTRLGYVSTRLAQAIEYAVLGRPYDGLALAPGRCELPEAKRRQYYLRAPNGMVHELDKLSEPLAAQVRSGDLQQLTEPEIRAYLEGELS